MTVALVRTKTGLRKPYPTINDFEVSRKIEIFILSPPARRVAKEVSDNTKAVVDFK